MPKITQAAFRSVLGFRVFCVQMPGIEGTCLHFTLGSCMYSRRNLLQQVKVPLQTKVVTYYGICEAVADVQYDIQTHENDNSRSERLHSALQLRSLQYPHSPELLLKLRFILTAVSGHGVWVWDVLKLSCQSPSTHRNHSTDRPHGHSDGPCSW